MNICYILFLIYLFGSSAIDLLFQTVYAFSDYFKAQQCFCINITHARYILVGSIRFFLSI